MRARWIPSALLACLLLSALPAGAQYFIWGHDPASLRWQQIHTPHFQLIFPENYAREAAYLADLLEYVYGPGSESLGHRPRKVPVIIHNQTVVSNGFVSWAPARMELFTNPPADNDVAGWLESLAVHEFRHVVQVDKLNRGITRVLSSVFGQHVTGLFVGLFYPLWLLEGDAVVMETVLTHGGRGRLPAFEQGLRALVLEKGIPSIDKAVLGSLREHVPNHYELGYQLVAGARVMHGADVWDKALDHVARRPYTVTPLTFGLKRHAGVNRKQLYHQTLEALEEGWTRQLEEETYTPFETRNRKERLFTSYREAAFLNDSTLMALKTGLADIPRVVAIGPDGRERRLFTPGFYQVPHFSTNGQTVAWAELRPDPRWEHRSWSEVHLYDLETGQKRRLTRQSRYFAPALSPDGSMVAVVETTDRNRCFLMVLDATDGRPIRRYAPEDNDFLMTPAWHPHDHSLVAVAQGEGGKRLVLADEQTGGFTTLLDAGHTEVSRPRFQSDGSLWFNGAFSGIDNVYRLDPETGEVNRLLSSRFGALDAVLSPGGDQVAWSDYSSDGYRLAVAPLSAAGKQPLERVEDHSMGWYRILASQEQGMVSRSLVPRREYLTLPYSKAANLLNFHSWGPFSLDVDNREVMPGVSVSSQNLLGTAVGTLGWEYDLNEELGRWFVRFSYYGLYPVLDLQVETGPRRSYYRQGEGAPRPFLWQENTLRLGASVPLSFRKGPVFMGLTPALRTSLLQARQGTDTPSFFEDNSMQTLEYRLMAYWQLRTVARDVRPAWGQSVDLQFRHTPFAVEGMGWIGAGRLSGFIPGLARHHSLRYSLAFQKREPGEVQPNTINYSFPGLIAYPRGITGQRDREVLMLSADYALPLMYPDWNLSGWFYLKKVSATAFVDHARVRNPLKEEEPGGPWAAGRLTTSGLELLGHMHLLRFFSPVNLGVRAWYRHDTQTTGWELLGSINL
jgi:hypothetical protein